MAQAPRKDDAVIIVGAGIFGLSTAVHLSRRGYTNVTVFDRQPYEKTLYSYFQGCDGASADINKIIRSAYGSQTEYQGLTIEALKGWNAWNDELASGETVPPGLATRDRVFVNNGNLSLSDAATLPKFERDTVENMEAAGHRNTQLVTVDPAHQRTAAEKGWSFGMDPFRRLQRGLPAAGVLDTTGGMAVADKACRFALHKAQTQGVRFVLGAEVGALESLVRGGGAEVVGIRTRDGKTHAAKLVILACGGWTPSLVPALDGLCEATAGSVALLRIPRDSPLFARFAPENFPTWTYKMRDGAGGGLYGFPRTEDGWLKIGYRGTKYTNPVPQADGKERSVPVTRWSAPSSPGMSGGGGERLTKVPQQALDVIRAFLSENLPELGAEGIDVSFTRVCWYTDSFDNHFVIDHVPGTEGSLMVATGGSGHAFKYLPNIGNWVVDVLEGKPRDLVPSKLWKWRLPRELETPYNVLMEGSKGSRALANVPLVSVVEPSSSLRSKL